MQWSANQVVEHIREHCKKWEYPQWDKLAYIVDEKDLNNARFNFREVSQIALDIGSEVHGMIEDYLTYTLKHKDGWIWPDGMSKEVENAFRAFWDWSIDNDLKPIEIEKTVYGEYWGGTLDTICLFNGKKFVIDWKSSKNHYPLQHGPQIAAYRSCVPDAVGSGVLRLDKSTGLPDWKDYSKRYEKDLAMFEKMVELYLLRHPRIAKGVGYNG